MLSRDTLDSDDISIANDSNTIRLRRRGGSIVSGCTLDGKQFLGANSAGAEVACFPLIPVGNRVEDNAFSLGSDRFELSPNTDEAFYIHGDGWLSTWQIQDHGGSAVRLGFDKTKSAGSPYAYSAQQTFSLSGPQLSLRLEVENRGDKTLPFGLGFHPFFPRTPQTTLFAPARTWWTERPGHLPDKEEPIPSGVDFSEAKQLPGRWLNNCFEDWRGAAQIIWPEVQMGLDIEADAALNRYMLYAPDPDCGFFCFEPMSHTVNALAHFEIKPMGLRLLKPGETFGVGLSMSVFDWSA